MQGLKFNEEMSFVPQKLLSFNSSPRHQKFLPELTFKPNIAPNSERIFLKKKSEPVLHSDDHTSGFMSTPRAEDRSKMADELLKSDRKHNRKIDLLRGASDISYLLETNKYKQKPSFNDHFNQTLSYSAHLLSSQQSSFLQKSLTTGISMSDKKDLTKKVKQQDAQEIYFPLDEIRGAEGPLPKSLSKLRKIVTTYEQDEEETILTERTKKGSKSPGRIVDAIAAGFDDCLEMNQSKIKESVKKVQAKTIIEHRSQNIKLSIPSGRKEVIVLSNWLNTMLEKIYNEETIKTEKIFEDIQLIYTACLQEIIRQVKVQCGERGQLLEKIWEAYIDLFDRVIRENTSARTELEDGYLNEIEEINKMYLMRQDQMNKELETTRKEREEMHLNLEKKKEELTYLKKKCEKQDLQLKSQKEWIEEVSGDMERLRAENTDFRKLVLEADVKLQRKYSEMHKNTDLRFKLKKLAAERKKQENKRKFGVSTNAISETNLSENPASTTKLDDMVNNTLQRIGEDNEVEKSPKAVQDVAEFEVQLYQDKAVDTNDLNNPVFEETETIEEWSEGQDEELKELSHIIKRLTKKESYEVLSDIESRLYEKVENEDDGEMKAQLVRLLSGMIKNEADLDNPDYQGLATDIIKKNVGRSEENSEDLGNILNSLKEMEKSKLLKVLDIVRQKLKKKGSNEKEKESQDLMNFIKSFINEQQDSARFEKSELNDLSARVRHLQSKRKLRLEQRLEFVDTIQEEEETPTSSEAEIDRTPSLLQRKKMNELVGIDENNMNRAAINTFRRIIKSRNDLKEGDLKLLLTKVLGSLDSSLLQITALKVANHEQDLDLQDLLDKKEEQDLHIRKLEEELEEYRARLELVEKENGKLQSTVEDKKKTKTNKLATLMQSLHKFKSLYGKGKKSPKDTGSGSQSPAPHESKPTSACAIDNEDENIQDHVPEEEEGNDAEEMMDNIVNLVERDVEEVEEENWSDNEEQGQTTSSIPKKNSVDLPQCPIPNVRTQRSMSKRATTFGMGTTIIKSFNLSQTERMAKTLSVNADSARALLMRTKEKKNVKATLPKPTVLKFISQIYIERMRASGALRELQLYVVAYDYFINKYGLKKVAESKCQQMFEAILAYSDNRRIKRFKNLVGLGESSCEVEEFDLYLTMFKAVDPLGNGNIIASSILDKIVIYFEYVELAVQGVFGKKIDQQNIQILISKLNQSKIIEKNGIPMIEFEDIVDEFFSVQKQLQDKTRGFVKDIFNAADLDSDKIITYPEFDILHKHLERETYEKDKVKILFFDQADMLLSDGSNEKVVSFNKFARICLDQGLFSQQKQNIFAKSVDSTDKIQTIQDLENNLKERLNEIRLRFMKAGSYNTQIKDIISKLYHNVKNPQKQRNVVWLTYRLIDEESKSQLLNYEIKRMLPKELLVIQKFVEDYEDWS